MAEVAGHLSLAELQAGYRTNSDAVLARHYQVIWLLAQGRTVAETAQLTGFVPRLGSRSVWGAPPSSGHRRLGGPGSWLLALPTSAIGGLQVLIRSALAGRERHECGVAQAERAHLQRRIEAGCRFTRLGLLVGGSPQRPSQGRIARVAGQRLSA